MSDIPPPPPGQQPPPPPSTPPPPPPPGNMAPPPGYVAYAGVPTPAQRVRRISGLSMAIMILVGIAGLGGVLNAFLTAGLQSDAEDLLAGRISETDFNDQLVSSSAFTALTGVATLAAMVLIMIWMFRIASNLRAFNIKTTWHPLFAVFGWFLPPAILYVIPFLMLREQWSKSTPSALPDRIATSTEDSGSSENPVLWIWWLTFGIWPLVALALSTDSLVGSFGDTGAEAVAQNVVDTSSVISILGSFIGLIAAGAWIFFVRQMATRHRSLTNES